MFVVKGSEFADQRIALYKSYRLSLLLLLIIILLLLIITYSHQWFAVSTGETNIPMPNEDYSPYAIARGGNKNVIFTKAMCTATVNGV